MKEFLKQNIVNLTTCVLVIVFSLLILFSLPQQNELSFSEIKEYANELRDKGLYQDAIDAYKEFLKDKTLNKKIRSNIHYFIAEIYRDNLKNFDKALSHYIKIKYIYPDTPLLNNINQKIVECLENSGRSREAQLALQESTSINQKQSTPDSKIILAKIDNDFITLQDFNTWFSHLPLELQKKYHTKQEKKKLLYQYINQELLYRRALRKGLQNDPEISKTLFEIKKNLMAQKLIQQEFGNIKVSDNEIELYYKANKEKYKKPLSQVYQQVKTDLLEEKIQEKSQEIMQKMLKANALKIFEDNLK